MIVVRSSEFRENLLHYLELIAKGKKIIVTRYNDPIAEVNPINDLDAADDVVQEQRLVNNKR